MMPEIPWNIQGIDPETRANAEASAQKAGVSVAHWLNSMIRHSASDQNPQVPDQTGPINGWSDDQPYRSDFAGPPYRAAIRGQNEFADLSRQGTAPFDRGLSQISAQIDDLTARLDAMSRAHTETAIPGPHVMNRPGGPSNAAPAGAGERNNGDQNAIKNIEQTLNNIVDLIEATDARTTRSIEAMRARMDSAKDVAKTEKTPPSPVEMALDPAPKTRFEARRDRRRQLKSAPSLETKAERASAAVANPGFPENVQTDFVSLARSLEVALQKNASLAPPVTPSDIEALRNEFRDLVTQMTVVPPHDLADQHALKALQDKLEQVSAEVNSAGQNLGGITQLDEKINLLFEQLEQTRQSVLNSSRSAASEAAQIALQESVQPDVRTDPDDQGLQSLKAQLDHISSQINTGTDFSNILADIDSKIGLLFEQLQQSHQVAADNHPKPAFDPNQLVGIEHKIGILFEQLEQSQIDSQNVSRQIAGEAVQLATREVTQEAVRAAAEHVAQYLPGRISGNESDLVRNLESGLNEIRAQSAHTDQQTQNTLNAVQDSLHAILDRLTFMDASVAEPALPQDAMSLNRQPDCMDDPRQSSAPISSAERNDRPAEPALQAADVNPPPIDPVTPSSRPASSLQEANFDRQPDTRETVEPAPNDTPVAAESVRPLEPGSGRPDPAFSAVTDKETAENTLDAPPQVGSSAYGLPRPDPAPSNSAGKSLRNASSNEELLAAARRAARNASIEKPGSGSRKKSLRDRLRGQRKQPRTAPVKSDSPAPVGSAGADKVFGMPRKPVLLTSLAILLFVGSIKIYGMISESSNTGEMASPAALAPIPQIEPDEVPQTTDSNNRQSSVASPPDPVGSAPESSAPVDTISSQPLPAPEQIGSATGEIDTQNSDITGSLPDPSQPRADNGVYGATSSGIDPDTGELPPVGIGSEQLRQEAAAGNPVAQFEVAARLAEGRGIAANAVLAAKWYHRAAAQGLAPAQYRLGSMYEKGHGVVQDRNSARIWYQRAAELGSRKAMHNLAVLYADGVAGEPDMAKAARWFRKAADFGLNDSQFNLGILYARGLGVPRNLAEAYKWLSIAAASGDTDAADRRETIANELDQQTLAAARLAVQTWRAQPLVAAANIVKLPVDGWGDTAPAQNSSNELPGRDIVRSAQKLLTQLGLNPGPSDGMWGPRTRNAITQFQIRANLPGTGLLTPQLFRKMQLAARRYSS